MNLFERIDELEALHKEIAGDAIKYYESCEFDPILKEVYFFPFVNALGVHQEVYDLMRKRLNILNAQVEAYKNFKEILKG